MSGSSVRWLCQGCEARSSPSACAHSAESGGRRREVSLITKCRAWLDVDWETEAIGRGDCPPCPLLTKCGEFLLVLSCPFLSSFPRGPLLAKYSVFSYTHTEHKRQRYQFRGPENMWPYTPDPREDWLEARGFWFQSPNKLSMNEAPLGCVCA